MTGGLYILISLLISYILAEQVFPSDISQILLILMVNKERRRTET